MSVETYSGLCQDLESFNSIQNYNDKKTEKLKDTVPLNDFWHVPTILLLWKTFVRIVHTTTTIVDAFAVLLSGLTMMPIDDAFECEQYCVQWSWVFVGSSDDRLVVSYFHCFLPFSNSLIVSPAELYWWV